MNKTPFEKLWSKVPAAWRPILGRALSILAGLFVAVVLHYVLYRIDLPSKPFIYVAF